MPRNYSSIDGGDSVDKVVKTKISPYPDLPKSASTELWILRQNLEAKAIKSAPAIIDFTSQQVLPEDSSASIFYKEFQYFNAKALSTIIRNDMVNGQVIRYEPITGLSSLNISYNPNNLVALQSTLKSYFDAFEINLDNYVPVAAEPTEEYTATETSERFELVVSFANIVKNERVEVEFLVMDTAFNDTIYT
jgi:hypothetical protein